MKENITLGDIATIQTGPFGSQLHASDYVENGIPVIMPTNIGNNLNIEVDAIAKINEDDLSRLSRYQVYEDDIVYSRRGDVERCAFITKSQNNWLCGTGCLRVRFKKGDIVPKFFAYQLSTDEAKGWISGHAVGSTMSNLNSSILAQVPLFKPDVEEQRAIAAVLSSLDDKIDLLHRQNATLEAMAEALFKQWFVVEAKEVWKEFAINEIAYQIKKSISPQNHPYKNFYYYSIPAYDLNKNPDIVYGKSILSNKFIVENNCILISKLNPQFPRIWYIMEEVQENSVSSTEFISVKPYDQQELPFIYCLLKNHDVSSELAKSASGTSGSHQRIKPEDIFSVTFSAPSRQYLTKFSNQVLPIYRRIQINNAQINTLEKLRDTLLPKLMSGEFRVDL